MGRERRRYERRQRTQAWIVSQLIRRDGAMCGCCKEAIADRRDMTVDHIVPVSRGGSDKLENLRLAHAFCNQERGAGFFEPEAKEGAER